MELEEANDASNNAPVPAISPAEPPYSTAVAKCKAPPSIAAPITSDGAATSHSTASESKESPNTTEGNGQRLHDAGKTPLLSTPPTTAKGTVTKEQPGVLLASGTYKRSSNPEESQADGADAELETIPGSGCQSSAERNIWSTFNPIWSCFDVKKARLPKAADREADWGGTVGRPDEIDKFLGLRKPANRKTMGYLRRSIEERLVMGGLVFIGPAGSGKSALLKAFLSDFLKEFASTPEAFSLLYRTRVLIISPQELQEPSKKLAARVKKFFATKKDRLSDVVPRFVVVDGMERVQSKSQQVLLSMVDTAASKSVATSGRRGGGGGGGGGAAGVRIMLTTRDASILISSLRKVVKPLKVELVDEVDGVRIVLRILQLENVGYELLAIKAIFRKNWPDLGRCIATARQVFCSKHFVSEVNTLKVVAPSVLVTRAGKSRHVQASDALEPLAPCSACTLRPPCQHISEQELAIRGIQRRSELPQRRSSTAAVAEALAGIGDVATVADCPRFVRRGACLEFNARGRCSYHHPLDAHIVETPRPRCPQCTIHLPCGHCDYDQARRRLGVFCGVERARIKKHVARLRRLHHNDTPQSRGRSTATATATAEASSPVKVSRENNDNVGRGPPSNTISTADLAPSFTRAQPGTERHADTVDAAATAAAAAAAADGGGHANALSGRKSLARSPSGAVPVSPSPPPGTPPPTPRKSREEKMAAPTMRRKTPSAAPNNTKGSTHVRGNLEPGKPRSGDIAYRKIETVISKLDGLCRDLDVEKEWIDDPRGGVVEFREIVFVKRLENLVIRCEQAHVEAETAAEAYLLRGERNVAVLR